MQSPTYRWGFFIDKKNLSPMKKKFAMNGKNSIFVARPLEELPLHIPNTKTQLPQKNCISDSFCLYE